MAWTLRHDAVLLTATLAFGVAAMPFLVYFTGVQVFGAYSGGGAMGFLGDFLRALAGLRWHAWSIALGPVLIVAVALGLWRLASARRPGGD